MVNFDRLYDNIYGTLICNGSLEKPSYILRYSLGFTESEIYVCNCQPDDYQSLKICTDICDLKTKKIGKTSKHSFDGVVAGNDREVIARVKKIADILNIRCNCQCHFEIYDDNLEFIDEYPKKKLKAIVGYAEG